MFLKPILALCNNRTDHAKVHPTLGSPEDWLSESMLNEHGYSAVTFDFFVNWVTYELDHELWQKKIPCPIEFSDFSGATSEKIIAFLRKDSDFIRFFKFAQKNSLVPVAMLFNDPADWAREWARLVRAVPEDLHGRPYLVCEETTKQQLFDLIQTKSGGPVPVGKKGLIYGTSGLECYLSHTNAAWPGDVDMILFKVNSFKPIVIVELKKDTGKSKFTFDQQCLGNYYPGDDGRKYDRLAILGEKILPDQKVPIVVLYYSTVPNEYRVKLERLDGAPRKLKSIDFTMISIDPKEINRSSKLVLDEIVRLSIIPPQP